MKAKSFLVFLFLFGLLALAIFTIKSAEGQLQWSNHFKIEVNADGSANWVVRQKTVLTTRDDEAAFWLQFNVTEISNRVHSMVSHASLVTGRSMRVENFEVDANVSSTGLSNEGIIQYQFDWLEFAERIGDNKLKLGDALSGELDLSRDDDLTIRYPSGYAPIFIHPSPDEIRESERTLTWVGRNFGAGEPYALFEKKSSNWTDIITGNMTLLAMVVVAISIGFLGYFFGMKRALGNQVLKSNVVAKQPALSELSVEDDEERVIRLLVAAGGHMYQSKITEQCRFSKSKTSELLSVMEEKRVITRKKMGRGKIVTLTQKQKA